jgi:hypothetical protein
MIDNLDLDQTVKSLIFELMLVLYEHGLTEVNVGGLMRLVGVENETAQEHDLDVMVLTDEFAKYVSEIKDAKRPDNETLH